MTATIAACSCPSEYRGIHDGDTIETTISAIASEEVLGAGYGCGALGDLAAGTRLVTRASVVADHGGGNACFNILSLTPLSITTGSFEIQDDGTRVLRLADECTGRFSVNLQSSSPTSSFLDNSGSPPWWLIRTFEVTANTAQCFPNGTLSATCMDAFTASNARQ